MFKYSGSLFGAYVKQQLWTVCVYQSSLTQAVSVNCVGSLCPYCSLGPSPESMECCYIISWVSIHTCSLPLLQSGSFIPCSVTKASCTSRVIAISSQAFSTWAPDPCPWWSRCFCSSLSEIPRWHRTEKSEFILYFTLSDLVLQKLKLLLLDIIK